MPNLKKDKYSHNQTVEDLVPLVSFKKIAIIIGSMSVNKGSLIVIDGTDGSGKKTQFDLLKKRLALQKIPFETISFPQYGKKNAGPTEEYLSGKYGTAHEVGPYVSSIFYAVDRYDASHQIRTWLENGIHVLADRYVGSNMGHQGGKITDTNERETFFSWVDDLEFNLFHIPRPDLNIILHVPTSFAIDLIRTRTEQEGIKNGMTRDIHEENQKHLEQAEQAYLHLASRFPQYPLMECVKSGAMLSRD